jgi:4-aminobutyrate---pyruvate transaminase
VGVVAGRLERGARRRWADLDVAHVVHPWTDLAAHGTRGPTIVVGGSGVFVYDEHGDEYLEAVAGLWCTSLGFGERELVEAAARQMSDLPFYHSANHRSTRAVIELSERLVEIAPGAMSRVFLTCSGSEANETQVKLLWYYNNARGRPRKKKVIGRRGAYHGSTIAAASIGGIERNHADFDLPLGPFLHVTSPHHYRNALPGESEHEFSSRLADELEELILREGPDTVAAFVAEPVMGAGGVIVPPAGYFERVQAVLRAYDVRLIADEVICAFGRTGNMWGCETYGIEPHSVTCAKALSSGYQPIGAVLVDEEMHDVLVEQSARLGVLAHGFTFGGHPTPAAVALRTLQLLEERDVIGHVRRVAPRFQARLRGLGAHPLVGDARGVGLLGALELVADKRTKARFEPPGRAGHVCAAFAERHGLIVRGLGDVVALCPPLVISETEVDELFDRLERALDESERVVARA